MTPLIEPLENLHRTFMRLRWLIFGAALITLPYLQWVMRFESKLQAQLLLLTLGYGLVCAMDEALIRRWLRRSRLALLPILVGDMAVVGAFRATLSTLPPGGDTLADALFLPAITAAAFGLGIGGGLLSAILANLFHLAAELSHGVLYSVELAIWPLLYIVAGLTTGYIAQRWEATQRPAEEVHRWISQLVGAQTIPVVARGLFRYLKATTGREEEDDSTWALLVLDRKSQALLPVAHQGPLASSLAQMSIGAQHPATRWLLIADGPIAFALDESAPIHIPSLEKVAERQWCLVLPISKLAQPFAVVVALAPRPWRLDGPQQRAMAAFIAQAGPALRQAISFAEMDVQARDAIAFLETSTEAAQGGAKGILDWLTQGIRQLFEATTVVIGLSSGDGPTIIRSATGEGAEQLLGTDLATAPLPQPIASPPSGPLTERLEHPVAPPPLDPPSGPLAERLQRSGPLAVQRSLGGYLEAPLTIRNEVCGTVIARRFGGDAFAESERLLFLMLVQRASALLTEEKGQQDIQALQEQTSTAVSGRAQLTEQAVSYAQDFRRLLRESTESTRRAEELHHAMEEATTDKDLIVLQAQVFAKEFRGLVAERERQVAALALAQQQVQEVRSRLVAGLAATIDPDGPASPQKVAELSVLVGQAMGLSPEQLRDLEDAALLRDIAERIVGQGKPAHAAWGATFLDSLGVLGEAPQLARSHHERYDGAGFPDGLAGEAIPLGARIMAVCETFESAIAQPVGMQTPSAQEVREYISTEAGRRFDPNVVQTFLQVYEERLDPKRWLAEAAGLPTPPHLPAGEEAGGVSSESAPSSGSKTER